MELKAISPPPRSVVSFGYDGINYHVRLVRLEPKKSAWDRVCSTDAQPSQWPSLPRPTQPRKAWHDEEDDEVESDDSESEGDNEPLASGFHHAPSPEEREAKAASRAAAKQQLEQQREQQREQQQQQMTEAAAETAKSATQALIDELQRQHSDAMSDINNRTTALEQQL